MVEFSSRLRWAIAPLVAAILSACAVGPDYTRPATASDDAYLRADAASADLPVPAADAEFWRTMGDPLLEKLVDQALAANHDLRGALARYEQAAALSRERRADRFPTLGASAEFTGVRNSAAQFPNLSRGQRDGELHSASISAVWELDFFGRVRRSIEAQNAQTDATAADLAGVQVAIVSELADTYFRLRGLQVQLQVARDNTANQTNTLDLITALLDNGRGTSFDADRARTQLELTRSRIAPLEAEAAVAMHRLSVLTGQTPSALAPVLEQAVSLPTMAATVNPGAPGDLLRRRPDIAAAERRLASASARIGVATADLFPRFTLGGLIGTQALGLGSMFERDQETRLISLGIDGSFLDVARVRARIAAANADAAGRLADYEGTVLRAMEETENSLVRLSRTQVENGSLTQAAQAARRAADTARLQFDGGAISVLEVLDAERSRLEAEDLLAQSTTRQATALVAVYKALAGGWPQQIPEAQGERYAARK